MIQVSLNRNFVDTNLKNKTHDLIFLSRILEYLDEFYKTF